MDTTFSHLYTCEQLTELPGQPSLPHYYYSNSSHAGGRDGIFVQICPNDGIPWLAICAFGRFGQHSLSGIFAMPNPHWVCVVAEGQGYLINANVPTSWERIAIIPILDVRPIQARQIIVFADHTRLMAYGLSGMQWKTKRLVWDALTITEVTEELIRGKGCDAGNGETVYFTVDLSSGTHKGGIEQCDSSSS